MKSWQIITLIAPDRPGIVDEVSRIIASEGGNIEESRMARLGGEFALMTMISGEGRTAENAAARVRAWADAAGITSASRATNLAPAPATAGKAVSAGIDLELPDRQGIVNRVTHFLAEHGANIEALETGLRPAPFTGTPVFHMQINVSAGGALPLEELRRILDSMADDEDIHITVDQKL